MSDDPLDRVPDWQIDLHGCSVEQALRKLRFAVQNCRQQRYDTLLAITGRGLHNARQESVLSPVVLAWAESEEARALGVLGARLESKGGAVSMEIARGARS